MISSISAHVQDKYKLSPKILIIDSAHLQQ